MGITDLISQFPYFIQTLFADPFPTMTIVAASLKQIFNFDIMLESLKEKQE